MKKITFILATLVLLVSSCKKSEDQFPSKTKVVSSPTITLNGDPVVILNVGDSYTEQGATYYDSTYGDNGSISSSTVVSTNQEGFFVITYNAVNQYGFTSSAVRLVAVTSADDALDVSGDYARVSNGYPVTVTKVGRGVFQTGNAGGNGFEDPVYFMFTGDSTMIMPEQFLINSGVPAGFVDPVYDFTASPPNYSYALDASGYGSQLRVFELQ
ncbi:MAG: DUF5011 domain-containing protein [Chitinophagales bacterium]